MVKHYMLKHYIACTTVTNNQHHDIYDRVHEILVLIIGFLTNKSLTSILLDISKQCKTRLEAPEHGVWTGSALFAYRMF